MAPRPILLVHVSAVAAVWIAGALLNVQVVHRFVRVVVDVLLAPERHQHLL
jgi:hypothetical protein